MYVVDLNCIGSLGDCEAGTLRGHSQIMSHTKNDFSNPPPPLVTNFPKKENFYIWTVTNSPTPLPPRISLGPQQLLLVQVR